MELNLWQKSLSALKQRDEWMRYSQVGLTCALLLSVSLNLSQRETIIREPMAGCETLTLSSDFAHPALQRKYGFYLASLMGNLTPKNVNTVKNAVLPFFAAKIYQDVAQKLEGEALVIIQDNVAMSFEPDRAFVEGSKTFVTGKVRLQGSLGGHQSTVRTYEFTFTVQNYTPVVTAFAVYNDVPHDQQWRTRHEKPVS